MIWRFRRQDCCNPLSDNSLIRASVSLARSISVGTPGKFDDITYQNHPDQAQDDQGEREE